MAVARMAAEQARAAAMHAAQEAEAKAQRERDASVDAIWDAMNAARFKMVDMFRRMDTDGSGQLEKDELAAALRKLGMQVSDDVLDRVFGMLDVDNDGGVEVSEFLERMRAVSTRRAHARAQCSAPRLTGACAQAGSLPQREPGPGQTRTEMEHGGGEPRAPEHGMDAEMRARADGWAVVTTAVQVQRQRHLRHLTSDICGFDSLCGHRCHWFQTSVCQICGHRFTQNKLVAGTSRKFARFRPGQY